MALLSDISQATCIVAKPITVYTLLYFNCFRRSEQLLLEIRGTRIRDSGPSRSVLKIKTESLARLYRLKHPCSVYPVAFLYRTCNTVNEGKHEQSLTTTFKADGTLFVRKIYQQYKRNEAHLRECYFIHGIFTCKN